MCLYTHEDDRRVAKEDIDCFKLLLNNLQSYHYRYKYILNSREHIMDESELKLERLNNHICIGTKGFHSYLPTEHNLLMVNAKHYPFSSFFRPPRPLILVNCIIPRGSVYYSGRHSDGVLGYMSNAIIPIEITDYL